MKSLLHPRWIFIANTFPLVLFLLFFFGEYNVIRSLISREDQTMWISLGSALAVLGFINFTYGLRRYIHKKKITWHYALAALIVFTYYLFLFGYHYEDFNTTNIPRWISSGDMFL